MTVKVTIEDRDDGLYVITPDNEMGPYETRKEAEEARRGAKQFYEEELNQDNDGGSSEPSEGDEPTGASDMATATAEKPKKKVASSGKKSTKKAVKKSSGDNPFASKLDASAGKKIEDMFLKRMSWKEIAEALGVSVSSVRFRFLDFLIKESYDFDDE